jgi:hypothetical protein
MATCETGLRNRILAEFEEGVRKLFAVTIPNFRTPRLPILGLGTISPNIVWNLTILGMASED